MGANFNGTPPNRGAFNDLTTVETMLNACTKGMDFSCSRAFNSSSKASGGLQPSYHTPKP